MQRINIVGNAGSGKSTLASLLGAYLQVPVIHLDTLFWEPGWREPQPEVFRERVTRALAAESWICEGNYATRTFDLRLPQSNKFVWVDTPRLICALRTVLRTYGGAPRRFLPVGCEDGGISNMFGLLRDIWTFESSRRIRIETELQRWGPMLPMKYLRGRREITQYLAEFPK